MKSVLLNNQYLNSNLVGGVIMKRRKDGFFTFIYFFLNIVFLDIGNESASSNSNTYEED